MLPEYLCGIIGHPLGHSLSPRLHTWGFAQAGIGGAYYAWPLAPDAVESFVQSVRLLPIHGVSVTIPHKQRVIPLLDAVSARAQAVGAVNTLYWEDGRLCGDNTDVLGFMRPLQAPQLQIASAMVLGAGGASRAVLAGLRALNIAQIWVSNRSMSKAQQLAQEFGAQAVVWEARTQYTPQLLINTTPLGMQGEHCHMTPWPATAFGDTGIAYDIVYNPLQTVFLRQAAAAGWRTIDGLDMFVGQGLAQFECWTGHSLDAQAARAMLRTYL